MALSDILNADLPTVGRQLRAGFDWWTGELAAMVPRRLRGVFARRAGTIASVEGEGFRLFRDGRELAAGAAARRVVVALPQAGVLTREIALPRLSSRDTRALLALDLDRLTPLGPQEGVADWEERGGDAVAGRRAVLIGVAPRAAAAAALARARAAGLEPVALGQATGAGGVRFDFLPQLREPGAAPAWASARLWWSAAAVLVLANLALVVERDVAATRELRATVATQQDAVALARRLRDRVRGEEARRDALLARRAASEPLRAIAAATTALPSTAWVQRLSWDGRALRLVGFGRGGVDVVSALRRSTAFVNVRATSADATPDIALGAPFDVTAELAPGPAA